MIKKYSVVLNDARHPQLLEDKVYDEGSFYAGDPGRIVQIMNTHFSLNKMAEEYVYMMSLSAAGQILGVFEVSHGTIGGSSADAREIFMRALLSGAAAFALVHNHPSGGLVPSDGDIKCFKRLCKLGDMMQVPMADFIIIADDGYMSFAETHKTHHKSSGRHGRHSHTHGQ